MKDLLRDHVVPGGVLGVLHDGEVEVTCAGYGNAQTKERVSPQTLFQIGSITKVWTATLVMQLVDEGLVDLDDPVRRCLPGFRLADDAATDAVTVRHLLTHQSGIADLDFGLFGRGDDCVERFVAALAGRPMLHDPGHCVSYCNSGFIVAGRLIEVLRDAAWDHVLRERIVEPLGLGRTFTLAEEAIVHRVAAGHDIVDGKARVQQVWAIPRSAGPAGLILSTAEDTLAFAKLHMCGGEVLSQASVEAMRTPQADAADAPRGLAWNVHAWDGVTVLAHDGGTFGQLSFLRVVPERNFAAILLTNSYGGVGVHAELFTELFEERLGIAMPGAPRAPDETMPVEPERYVGEWMWQGLSVNVAQQDGALVATLTVPDHDVPPIPMHALGDDRFVMRVPPLSVDSVCSFFEPRDDGTFRYADLRGRLMVRC